LQTNYSVHSRYAAALRDGAQRRFSPPKLSRAFLRRLSFAWNSRHLPHTPGARVKKSQRGTSAPEKIDQCLEALDE
jgi:hypothetical protein